MVKSIEIKWGLIIILFGHLLPIGVKPAIGQSNLSLQSSATVVLAPPAAYLKIDIPAQGKILAALPFVPYGHQPLEAVRRVSGWGDRTLKLILWDSEGRGYQTMEGGDTGWHWGQNQADSPISLQSGDGFWLENHSDMPAEVMIFGGIPIAPSLSPILRHGLTLFAWPYPVVCAVQDTPLAEEMSSHGDLIYGWNGTNYWVLADSNVLEISQGYWYLRKNESVTWQIERPYGDMFSDEALPAIVGLSPRMPESIGIVIRQNENREKVDLLSQELLRHAGFKPDGAWRVVGQNLDGNGRVIEVDVPAEGQGWVYLVVNSKDRNQVYATSGGEVRLRPEWMKRAGDSAFNLRSERSIPDVTESTASPKQGGSPARPTAGMRPGGGVNPNIVHVDSRAGRDTFSGHAQSISGNDGPKKTLHAGVEAVKRGGTVIVHGGTYGERRLNIAGREVKVQVIGQVHFK